MGHLDKDCRSKPEDPQKHNNLATPQKESKPIVCFTCKETGHKSPQCPRKKDKIKKVIIKVDKVEKLAVNYVMATIGGVRLRMTIDLGAEISIVPKELIKTEEFTRGNLQM